MGRSIRQTNNSDERTSTYPQNNQKPISITEIQDEDMRRYQRRNLRKYSYNSSETVRNTGKSSKN